VIAAGTRQHLVEVGLTETCAGRGSWGRGRGREPIGRRGRKIWDELNAGNIVGREFEVIVFAGTEKEAGSTINLNVVVATDDEARMQSDTFRGSECLSGNSNRKNYESAF
jgi:hypothetical protein